MAGQSFWVRGLVLRKTKLGESDLIVELLNDEGCLVRAVAKGARKPKSSFASWATRWSFCALRGAAWLSCRSAAW